jgi:RNA-directed DNA polymerase
MYLTPEVESKFHPDSYAYRSNRGAREALKVTQQRCWKHDWVIDLDVRGFFDNLDHDLLMQVVRKHTDCKWILLYAERWLKAPIKELTGELTMPGKGTPQGGVVSPLMANIFLHHAFDVWMSEKFPAVPFARYADDAVAHCKSEAQAKYVLYCIRRRLQEWKLELNPDKTRIVYCKDSNRHGNHNHESFDFLGFTFRQRAARNRDGQVFGSFLPSVSKKARRRMKDTIKRWCLQRWTDRSLQELADICNPVLRGWINYYGPFDKRGIIAVLWPINFKLAKWARAKYRKNRSQSWEWLERVKERAPNLFAHWAPNTVNGRVMGAG